MILMKRDSDLDELYQSEKEASGYFSCFTASADMYQPWAWAQHQQQWAENTRQYLLLLL